MIILNGINHNVQFPNYLNLVYTKMKLKIHISLQKGKYVFGFKSNQKQNWKNGSARFSAEIGN